MSATTKKMPVSLRTEIAFALTKFKQLPEQEQERLLGELRSDDKGRRTKVAKVLGDLLCQADSEELTRFINDKVAGGQKVFYGYLPYVTADDYNSKCWMVGTYFYQHLPKSGTEIPMPLLS